MIQNEIMEDARKIIGEHLRETRETKKISINQLIKKTGLRFEQIKSIEAGEGYNIDTFLKYLSGVDCYFYIADRDGEHLNFNEMIRKS